jgi:hypothetical protein
MNIELMSFLTTMIMFLIFIVGASMFVYHAIKTPTLRDLQKPLEYSEYKKYHADVGVMTNIEKIVSANTHLDISTSLTCLNDHLGFFRKYNIKFDDKHPDYILETMQKHGLNKIISMYGFDEVETKQNKIQNIIRDRLIIRKYYNMQSTSNNK